MLNLMLWPYFYNRPTTVHRFLIRGTIEERMYEALQIKANNVTSHDTEENTLTVKNLLDLFIREDEREP